MRLRIQDGILLKAHSLPYDPDARPGNAPHGWTPDDTAPEVQARAGELYGRWVAEGRFVVRDFALETAALQLCNTLRQQEQPQPGWMVVTLGDEDRAIRDAYLALFICLSVDAAGPVNGDTVIHKLTEVVWPPDGFYVFEDGEMHPEGE